MAQPGEQERPSGPGLDAATREGARAWARAGAALATVRRRELAAMTDADARRLIGDLLALLEGLPPKDGDTGLVEQQRGFSRLR